MGYNLLSTGVMGAGGNADLHTRDSRSWEWGLTITSLAFRLTNNVALTCAFQTCFVHNHFQGNYVVTTNDGATTVEPMDEEKIKKSYIGYSAIRVPIMVEWQKTIGCDGLYASAGLSLDMRMNDDSHYKIGKKKYTATEDINMNPVGLNLDFMLGYGNLMLYGRAALTPLLKTDRAPKCFPVAIGLGVRI